MILKGSQRGGGLALGHHLLNGDDNDHIEVHEVRGFIAQDVLGAMKESYAVSRGTRCKQHLFSVSLNPPESEDVRIEIFEQAIEKIEKRTGLSGQPRVVVFHEKEGRRHCHAVWSRIDPESMTAVNMAFFKNRLREVSKEIYLEQGWKMPRGFMDSKARNPLNYSLKEYQQAKRIGRDPRDLKQAIQECWAVSDSKTSFEAALKEHGLFLARGDKRGFVAIPVDKRDEALSISRFAGSGGKSLGKKAVKARLGDPEDHSSVEETQTQIAKAMTAQFGRLLNEARQKSASELRPLMQEKQALKAHHREERQKLDHAQEQRWAEETKTRSARLNSGLKGLWQKLTGKRTAIQKQNVMEVFQALERDRGQRHDLITAQLQDRQNLQNSIRAMRQNDANEMTRLHRDMAINEKRREVSPAKLIEQRLDQMNAQEKGPNAMRTAFKASSTGQKSAQDRLSALRSSRVVSSNPEKDHQY